MPEAKSAFASLPADASLAAAVRALQVALQAELLRAGACWEESLTLLREMANQRRAFPSAEDALRWYRAPSQPRR